MAKKPGSNGGPKKKRPKMVPLCEPRMPYVPIKPLPEAMFSPESRAESRRFNAVGFLHSNPAEAVRLMDEAVALVPEDWNLRTDRGYMMKSLGRTEEAKQDFLRALAHEEVPMARYHLGEILNDEGKHAEAVEHLSRAAGSPRLIPGVHFELARAHRALGNIQKAEEHERLYREEADALRGALRGAVDIHMRHFLDPENDPLARKEKADAPKIDRQLRNMLRHLKNKGIKGLPEE